MSEPGGEGTITGEDERREIPLSERSLLLRICNYRLFGTENRWTVDREYTGYALTKRRLKSLREHAEHGASSHGWFGIFMFLPVLVWLVGMLASLGSGMFWQSFLIVIPAVLASKAIGVAVSRVLEPWTLRRIKKQTIFTDQRRPHGFWLRHAYLLLAAGFILLWLAISIVPAHQFIQNLIDLLLLPAAAVSAVGAGLVTRALFHYEDDEIICVACRSAAPIEAGDTCPGCQRDLSALESRFMGRHRVNLPMLLWGILLLALATGLLFMI